MKFIYLFILLEEEDLVGHIADSFAFLDILEAAIS